MEKTFILIKPDAIKRQLTEEIIEILKKEQFEITKSKYVQVTEDIILTHYKSVIESLNIPYFKDAVITCFKNKTVWIAELVSKDNTIKKLRQLIWATDPTKAEPHTIRGMYGIDSFEEATREQRMIENLVHASDSHEAAQFELSLWFDNAEGLGV